MGSGMVGWDSACLYSLPGSLYDTSPPGRNSMRDRRLDLPGGNAAGADLAALLLEVAELQHRRRRCPRFQRGILEEACYRPLSQDHQCRYYARTDSPAFWDCYCSSADGRSRRRGWQPG